MSGFCVSSFCLALKERPKFLSSSNWFFFLKRTHRFLLVFLKMISSVLEKKRKIQSTTTNTKYKDGFSFSSCSKHWRIFVCLFIYLKKKKKRKWLFCVKWKGPLLSMNTGKHFPNETKTKSTNCCWKVARLLCWLIHFLVKWSTEYFLRNKGNIYLTWRRGGREEQSERRKGKEEGLIWTWQNEPLVRRSRAVTRTVSCVREFIVK